MSLYTEYRIFLPLVMLTWYGMTESKSILSIVQVRLPSYMKI